MLCFKRESLLFVSTQFVRVLITIIIISIYAKNASTFAAFSHFFTILSQIQLAPDAANHPTCKAGHKISAKHTKTTLREERKVAVF